MAVELSIGKTAIIFIIGIIIILAIFYLLNLPLNIIGTWSSILIGGVLGGVLGMLLMRLFMRDGR